MATLRVLVGVDIGTQGTKGALFSEDGRCLAHAFQRSNLRQPKPGVVEEDPEAQVASVCRVIRRCLKDAGVDSKAVAGIGIDGQMAGLIGVGADGRHVTCYDSWLDTRCAEQIAWMEREGGDEVLASAGCAPSFNHGPKKLWWMTQRPKDYRRIAKFVQPGGYAAMRLCGLDADAAYIDTTYLHFSGFADNRRSRWNADLCRSFGFDESKLPEIVAPESLVGEVTAAMARSCGIRPGVPVVAGCGDTAASFLASGAVRVGIGVDVAGTASVFAATTDAFRADTSRVLGCGQSAVPGLWHPYAYINGGGMNLEWFRRNVIGNNGKSRPSSLPTFEQLNVQAAKLKPAADAPMFIPHLGGRVCPSRPHLRGAWTGLSWNHGPHDLYRAVLEGVGLEYGVYQRVLKTLYPTFRFSEVRVTGGGASSDLWNSIKADALQTPLRRLTESHGAPQGAAMLAGWGVGVLKDLPTAARTWIGLGNRIKPTRSLARHYASRLAHYESLLQLLTDHVAPTEKQEH